MKKVFILFFILWLCPVFVFGAEQININTASLTELDKLTGIGPKYAQAIIDARPFSSIDDLDRVKGIGPATLAKIKVQGFACVDCETSVAEARPPENLSPDSVEVGPLINYPAGIFINEILPSPEGSDETDEWIELYNSNNFEVDLSGWKIQDTNGTPKTFIILVGIKISASGFLVFKRPETKIMLNNDTDGLNLLTPDNKVTDSVTFNSAPIGQSYNKINPGLAWSNTLTPGNKNIIASNVLPKTEKSDKNNVVGAKLADLSQSINTNQEETLPAQAGKVKSPWFLFYITLATAIISASVILFIKFKLQKNVRT